MSDCKICEERMVMLPHVKRDNTTRKMSLLQKGKPSDIYKLKAKNYRWWRRMSCEPKIDGIRAVYYDKQLITFNQKKIYNCQPIIREIKKVIHPNEVFDGELYGVSWEYTQSIVMSSVTKKRIGKVKFNIFDCIPRFEFERGIGLTTQDVRYGIVGDLFQRRDFKHTIQIQSFRPKGYADFEGLYDNFVNMGFEGAMLKHLDQPYLFYKGDAWLKCKHTETEDVTIIGYKPGKGKYSGVLGSLVCEDERGNTINVSGMDDDTRKVVWRQRKKHLGKVVEVKYYKLTEGGGMYSAQFIRWRDDK